MRAFLQLCFLRFFPAWFLAFILASVFHSHFVLFELVALNIDIPITKWAYMVFADMRGLALTYGIIIAVALAISFFIAHLLLNRLKKTDNSSAGQSKSNAITIFMFGVAGAVGFFVTFCSNIRHYINFFWYIRQFSEELCFCIAL